MTLKKRVLALTVSAFLITGASIIDFSSTPKPHQLQAHANVVKGTYESRLFSLSPYKQGHFGLRMYRQTQDTKYKTTILSILPTSQTDLITLLQTSPHRMLSADIL